MKLLDILDIYRLPSNNDFMGSILEEIKNDLLKCDEFKNVKKINILNCPTYNYYKSGSVHVEQVESLIIDENTSFNEVVDLYSININKLARLDKIKLKNGLWKMPTVYSPETLAPMCEIRYVYSPEMIQNVNPCVINPEDILKDVVDEFLKCIHGPVNVEVPYDTKLIVRCSSRSFKPISQQL